MKVIEPSQAILQLHDELIVFKKIYENLDFYLSENTRQLQMKELIIKGLQEENSKLRIKVKKLKIDASLKTDKKLYDDNKLISDFKEALYSPLRFSTKNFDLSKEEYLRSIYNFNKKKLQVKEEEDVNEDNNEDFNEVMRVYNISFEDVKLLSEHKDFSNIIEALEMLSKMTYEKNCSIKILKDENNRLNQNNADLNNVNFNLGKDILRLQGEISALKNINVTQVAISNENTMISNNALKEKKKFCLSKPKLNTYNNNED